MYGLLCDRLVFQVWKLSEDYLTEYRLSFAPHVRDKTLELSFWWATGWLLARWTTLVVRVCCVWWNFSFWEFRTFTPIWRNKWTWCVRREFASFFILPFKRLFEWSKHKLWSAELSRRPYLLLVYFCDMWTSISTREYDCIISFVLN